MTDSESSTDDDSDSATIRVKVIINKDYTRTADFKPKRDKWALAEIHMGSISIENLRNDIPDAFKNEKKFKSLWENDQYEWKIFSFSMKRAEIEIDVDEDLQDEIECFLPSENDSSDSEDSDPMDDNKYFKVFTF